MESNNNTRLLISILVLAVSALLVTGCFSSQPAVDKTFSTRLLVKAPDQPLPRAKAVTVQSRTQDEVNGVSHVELYAVEMPGDTNVLLNAQAAPFEQTIFTASQSFVPNQVGDYVIKVVGYNKAGNKTESEYVRFSVQ
jgi:hypothetical protein